MDSPQHSQTRSRECDDPFAPVDVPGNPFAPLPVPEVNEASKTPTELLLEDDRYWQEVNGRGEIIIFKMESGLPVPVRNLGSIREHAEKALWNAALQPAGNRCSITEIVKKSAIQMAANNLARDAAYGDQSAIDKLFDRLLGKPKQTTESKNLNLNIDAVLTAEDDRPRQPIVDIPAKDVSYG